MALEIDGETHAGDAAEEYDAERMRFLASADIVVMRIANENVYEDIYEVLGCIAQTVELLRVAVRKRHVRGNLYHPLPPP